MLINLFLVSIVILLLFLSLTLRKMFENFAQMRLELLEIQALLSTSTIKKSTSRKSKKLLTNEASSAPNSFSMPFPATSQPVVSVQDATLPSLQPEKSYSPMDDAPTTSFNPLIHNDK